MTLEHLKQSKRRKTIPGAYYHINELKKPTNFHWLAYCL